MGDSSRITNTLSGSVSIFCQSLPHLFNYLKVIIHIWYTTLTISKNHY